MRESSFKPGDCCGNYRIRSLIGLGGVAEVYKATHIETNRSVALKTLRPFFAADPYIIEHMMAEAELLSKLRHPNVVHVEASGIEKGVLWMAMEYVPGITLRALLRSLGALSARRALYYAKEIADGAAAAHAMGVVHRDLKPENVMITRSHEVKVLDMGAAKFYGWDIKKTVRGAIFGTPLYMSPEHIREEPMDVRSDVYSLGLILYEMLAGRHPFAQPKRGALSKHEVCELQIRVDPTPLAELLRGFPVELSNFVQRAVAKDRKKRPSSMLEFAQEARAFLVTLGAEDQDVPWLRRVPASQRARVATTSTPDDDGPWDSASQSERRGPTSGAVRRVGPWAPLFPLRDSEIDNEDKSTLVFTRLHRRESAEIEVALDEDDLIQEEIERNSILVEFEDDDPQGEAQTTAVASEAAPGGGDGDAVLRSGIWDNAVTRRCESLPDGSPPSREAVLPCAPDVVPEAPMSAPAMSASHSLRTFETDRVATLALDREIVSGIRKAPAPPRRTKSRALVTVLFAGAIAATVPLAYSRLSASAATSAGIWAPQASSAPSEPAPATAAQEQAQEQALELELELEGDSAPQPAPAPPMAVGSPEAPVQAAESNTGAKKPAAVRRRSWGSGAAAWNARRPRFDASYPAKDGAAKDAKNPSSPAPELATPAQAPPAPISAPMSAPIATPSPAPTATPPPPPPPSKRYSPTEI
jgi:serine/threonine protein kinase